MEQNGEVGGLVDLVASRTSRFVAHARLPGENRASKAVSRMTAAAAKATCQELATGLGKNISDAILALLRSENATDRRVAVRAGMRFHALLTKRIEAVTRQEEAAAQRRSEREGVGASGPAAVAALVQNVVMQESAKQETKDEG